MKYKTLDNEKLIQELVDAVICYHATPSIAVVFENYEACRAEILRRLASSAYVLEDFNNECAAEHPSNVKFCKLAKDHPGPHDWENPTFVQCERCHRPTQVSTNGLCNQCFYNR